MNHIYSPPKYEPMLILTFLVLVLLIFGNRMYSEARG